MEALSDGVGNQTCSRSKGINSLKACKDDEIDPSLLSDK